ncbi:MAG TPA: TetR/AcrR family transcriptional regulator [Solirubrobacteraceae bacterium]|jgi:AcrR family transcriptional regulator
MPVRKDKSPSGDGPSEGSSGDKEERYRRLPTGNHGLDPEQVRLDQRRRLREAMLELIVERGYPGVRIADLAKLAHVSAPTFYDLYAGKEELFLDAYASITSRMAETVLGAYSADRPDDERLSAAIEAACHFAADEPETVSLLVLGAFGAGPGALEHRRASLAELERSIQRSRDGGGQLIAGDYTVKAILGGIREALANRLHELRYDALRQMAPEIVAWAGCYPRRLPDGLAIAAPPEDGGPAPAASERAKRAEGPLPSGRSELPRQSIVKSQRERIVDATASIVAEKGLAGLTIPEIARRASISHQTFYSIYPSKQDAFLGAQKVSMHQAVQVTGQAFTAQGPDWPHAVAAGLQALLEFLASEPAHARLTLVDTFGASRESMEIRGASMAAFREFLKPGYMLAAKRQQSAHPPALAAEAVTGGIWQILHYYIEHSWFSALPALAPQLTYFALTPFLGLEAAVATARSIPPPPAEQEQATPTTWNAPQRAEAADDDELSLA